jgi:hypothetical protein
VLLGLSAVLADEDQGISIGQESNVDGNSPLDLYNEGEAAFCKVKNLQRGIFKEGFPKL